jgi:hypothetical protein
MGKRLTDECVSKFLPVDAEFITREQVDDICMKSKEHSDKQAAARVEKMPIST